MRNLNCEIVNQSTDNTMAKKKQKKTRVYTPTTLTSTIHVEQFKQGSQNRLTLTIPEGGES